MKVYTVKSDDGTLLGLFDTEESAKESVKMSYTVEFEYVKESAFGFPGRIICCCPNGSKLFIQRTLIESTPRII